MKRAFVLMTAMPPTTGHWQLVQFANQLADGVVVIVCTQPDEPFAHERVEALRKAAQRLTPGTITVVQLHRTMAQDPDSNGFWDMWQTIMQDFGVTPNDYIVASEAYGQKIAEITGTRFFPYDIERTFNPAKGTRVREQPLEHFNDMLPEFQKHLRTRVTIFGAESTGKTTLSRQLAKELNATWLFEYARPYLEKTVNEITVQSMTEIWKGQTALQQHGQEVSHSPYIIQDTDLFSTVGYWQFPHWQDDIGSCPPGLEQDALRLKSDLYIVTQSNIPFEKDPLRYGGDHREGSDEYWIDVCKRYELPYVVLETNDPKARLNRAKQLVQKIANDKLAELAYDRGGF